jgi:hypothetical protein
MDALTEPEIDFIEVDIAIVEIEHVDIDGKEIVVIEKAD